MEDSDVMTDYELVDLWVTHWALAMSVFVAFLSATSALVIVAHLKGAHLERSVYRLTVSIYSVAAVFLIVLFAKIAEGALNVRGQMHESDLQWFVAAYEPQFTAPSVLALGVIVQIALAVGSLWYFRSTRSHRGTS
jgi:hypothetical protein